MTKSQGIRQRGPTHERILRRTDRSGECWLWTARLNREGYAEIRIDGTVRMAHRASYEAFVGPIPAGLQLDHLCRVRNCVNPQHLEPVTARVNVLRMLGLPSDEVSDRECAHGHPFDEANTYWHRGKRHCRSCNAEAARRYKQRNVGGAA